MGFFTKKEKKPREIKETDSTFVKLWYNPRTHAMMVLGAYFVFFLVVILFLKSLPNNQTVETKKKTGESIEELFKNDPYESTCLYLEITLNSSARFGCPLPLL